MPAFLSPSSTPGIPTPESDILPSFLLDDLFGRPPTPPRDPCPLGFLNPLRAPPHPPTPHSYPRPPSVLALSVGGSQIYYLPSRSMLDLLAFSLILLPHACAKLHRVPMAPAGYHWRKLPLAEEDQPQAPGLPVPPPASPSASRLDSWASSWYRFRLPARTPPLVMWCPFTLSWYSAIHSCTCHLLPTGEYQTEWAEGNGLLPYSWLLRPPGYAVFPASYPPADCMICREIGRFGLVRDDCPLHDPFPWDWQVWPGRGRE